MTPGSLLLSTEGRTPSFDSINLKKSRLLVLLLFIVVLYTGEDNWFIVVLYTGEDTWFIVVTYAGEDTCFAVVLYTGEDIWFIVVHYTLVYSGKVNTTILT